jgi:hypothetical protein
MHKDISEVGRQATLSPTYWDRRFAGQSAVIERVFEDGGYMVFVPVGGMAIRAGYRLLVSEHELCPTAG